MWDRLMAFFRKRKVKVFFFEGDTGMTDKPEDIPKGFKLVNAKYQADVPVADLEDNHRTKELMMEKIKKNLTTDRTLSRFYMRLHKDHKRAEEKLKYFLGNYKNIEAQILFVERLMNGKETMTIPQQGLDA